MVSPITNLTKSAKVRLLGICENVVDAFYSSEKALLDHDMKIK